ncbi:37S ribosomal protein S23 mitochondrial [Lunasporangiospora selenospora]|uniref:Small ribosomal subunit protein mS29 n=1 Tax=Lunasporangiospora selenospora TaxID=979761 RepID=A0A9P6KD41_9FUNG|nr:37S ribosomal protein S23 mitochondrial [Lunasporangiospora selenospora]
MAARSLGLTPLLNRTSQSFTARARAAIPAQYANYVTASTVVYAAKSKKGAVTKAKGQSNSFRKKKAAEDDQGEGAIGGANRLNEKYYMPPTPVKVEEFLPSLATKENVGQILGFPSTVIPALSQTAYPTLLNEQFNLIKPAALAIREPTVSLLEKVDNAMKTPSAETRIVLTGNTGSGKSALLLQTVSHCLSAGWVVIYVPRASTWMDSSSAYSKVPGSAMFVQPSLASTLAGQIINTNRSVLTNLVTSADVRVGRHDVAKGAPLLEFLEIGVKDPFAAQDVMEVFLNEIGAQKEIPTLLAVDEINNFFRPTQYLSHEGKEIDPDQLKLPNLFLNYISGKKSLNHGAVLTATSDHMLEKKSEVLEAALGLKQASPYKQFPQNLASWTQGLTKFEVPNYTRQEAKSIFDYYKKGNVLFDVPSEKLFLSKFIASDGNPRKFFTACAKGV